ncbi:acetyl-CoA C-acetyltransferase [Gordonia rhizosphera]|uniref:Putative acetyl-CoA acyltransferase n=1 Tax=Gordonia rhizosphera NBRC 16068 TaxID=1108045 RepID=K6VZP0_9ACTN|nr:acetyl-CoA C-acetyltransferase [Gordonia rhizosphera]GAB92370.1 putative acetyl-CoA acyltransferase [Gordonia rhizosphera NBRC 16068]
MTVSEAYVVDGVRTAVGKKNGALAHTHPADIGGRVLCELITRTGIDPVAVDDVIFGCLDGIGPQASNVARTSWLAGGLPEAVPAVTLDRQCGSSQQALHFAAQGVMSGTADLVVAGGTQNMSTIPIAVSALLGEQFGHPDATSRSEGWQVRFGDQEFSQFRAADLIAEHWDISRGEMESFALESHRRAAAAIDEGYFVDQIVPIGDFAIDEGPRRNTSLEKMGALQPLSEGGRITAAVSSQISDGAAAILVASEDAVAEHGLRPKARVHQMTVRGDDPVMMLTAPIIATRLALDKAGMTIDDIDLFEANEAFASVVLAWQRELGIPLEKVNVNGGAIALGHPLGATGARLIIDLIEELRRADLRFGLVTMCQGGGQANATIIERLQ